MSVVDLVDIVSKEIRSRMMAANRRRDTNPEMVVRRQLHTDGFRYRLDVRALPGSPDIVLRRYNAAIFVHGCYWHRHNGCGNATTPKTNTEFWSDKFEKNIERDRRSIRKLQELGWRVGVIWECGLSTRSSEQTLGNVVDWLRAKSQEGQFREFE